MIERGRDHSRQQGRGMKHQLRAAGTRHLNQGRIEIDKLCEQSAEIRSAKRKPNRFRYNEVFTTNPCEVDDDFSVNGPAEHEPRIALIRNASIDENVSSRLNKSRFNAIKFRDFLNRPISV